MEIPLGKQTSYPDRYDPALLFPVSREINRSQIGVAANPPFFGYDHWRAYEVSWLDWQGMPKVAMANILVPYSSPNLIESKSMKLYFNSLNQHRFRTQNELSDCVQRDLSKVAGSEVIFQLMGLEESQTHEGFLVPAAHIELLDNIPLTDPSFEINDDILRIQSSDIVDTIYISHLFRSNCPVTSQPDWGTVVIDYHGREPDRAALLAYILSYRMHEGFHEHCVERIFVDLLAKLAPSDLTVSINFTRRGGLEINPIRSMRPLADISPLGRFARQ